MSTMFASLLVVTVLGMLLSSPVNAFFLGGSSSSAPMANQPVFSMGNLGQDSAGASSGMASIESLLGGMGSQGGLNPGGMNQGGLNPGGMNQEGMNSMSMLRNQGLDNAQGFRRGQTWGMPLMWLMFNHFFW